MTLLVRDEADIVDAQLAFHLAAGVDFVVATDHRSQDGTTEILRRYEREGVLRLLREDGEAFLQAEWVTRMARLAATEHGADWVIHADADEFFWPRGGDLKEVLAAIPPGFGIVFGLWRHFAPRPDDGSFFAERMLYRVSPESAYTGPADPFHPQVKVAHRGDPDVTVAEGNHDARSPRLRHLRGWFPLEVLHFPVRSREQSEGKYGPKAESRRLGFGFVPLHVQAAERALAEGRFDEKLAEWEIADGPLERGLASGELACDTRLRDALRRLAGAEELPREPSFPRPSDLPRLSFSPPHLGEQAAFAADASALLPFDARVRLARRLEAFERRLAEVEKGLLARAAARLRRGRGR
jgi:hypothetical protein